MIASVYVFWGVLWHSPILSLFFAYVWLVYVSLLFFGMFLVDRFSIWWFQLFMSFVCVLWHPYFLNVVCITMPCLCVPSVFCMFLVDRFSLRWLQVLCTGVELFSSFSNKLPCWRTIVCFLSIKPLGLKCRREHVSFLSPWPKPRPILQPGQGTCILKYFETSLILR